MNYNTELKRCMICGRTSWIFFLTKVSRNEHAHPTCIEVLLYK